MTLNASAPILLIGFRRPDAVAAQIRNLSHLKPGELFVAIDGPRADHPDDGPLVEASRKAIELIDWPCKVHTRFLEENHGCRYAPPEAILWMFESVDAGIILEEDCWPEDDFIRYATELLERYKDDERVGTISGNNYFGFQSNKSESYHFENRCDIWGWATWRRVWRHYDGTLEKYRDTVEKILHPGFFDRHGHLKAKYLQGLLRNPTTWDTQLCVMLEAKGYLNVHPRVNLVRNTGFTEGALHTGGFVFEQPHYAHSEPLGFPLVHPAEVVRDAKAERKEERRFSSYIPRAITLFGLKFGKTSWGGGFALPIGWSDTFRRCSDCKVRVQTA